MQHELALAVALSQVTENAALAAYPWIGRGDKQAADAAAVDAMRNKLNQIEMCGEIVIGEGEIDQAPMLYIGEQVGTGLGHHIDIAVDPIDGTRMTAMGQNNALSVLAAGAQGTLLRAPDMYMEKLIVGPAAHGVIDLALSLPDNVQRIAQKINKPLSALSVMILAKARHEAIMATLHTLGVKVLAIPDGDVAAAALVCLPDHPVDMLYGIGGAPEGVIAAALVRTLGGDMQGRLLTRHQAKGASQANLCFGQQELARCRTMGIEPGQILQLKDMARSDQLIVSATGITKGDLVAGIEFQSPSATSETLLICGQSRTVRRICTLHPQGVM